MDLIDRKALKDALNNYYEGLIIGDPIYALRDVFCHIDNAPTVEIPNCGGQVVPDTLQGWRYEERPHGKWLSTKYYNWKCSECGKNPTIGMGYVQNHTELFNFCPNCGADMREKHD